MTQRKTEKVVETKEHSFETVLGIPSGTTEVVKTRVTSTTKKHDDYDHKDDEIEEDFLSIHDNAMELFELLMDEIDDTDQSKRSRLAEVAGQLLNTALTASERRRVLKAHIDTTKQKERALDNKAGAGGKTVNNVFFGTHEEMMKLGDELRRATTDDSKVIEHESPPAENSS